MIRELERGPICMYMPPAMRGTGYCRVTIYKPERIEYIASDCSLVRDGRIRFRSPRNRGTCFDSNTDQFVAACFLGLQTSFPLSITFLPLQSFLVTTLIMKTLCRCSRFTNMWYFTRKQRSPGSVKSCLSPATETFVCVCARELSDRPHRARRRPRLALFFLHPPFAVSLLCIVALHSVLLGVPSLKTLVHQVSSPGAFSQVISLSPSRTVHTQGLR